MKATIKYVPLNSGKRRQVTIPVTKNDPNDILCEAIAADKIGWFDFVATIKCGRYEYQWHGRADGALPKDAWGRVRKGTA